MITTGYHARSMQAVADDAQMSVGLIYSHFGGKEELLQSVIVESSTSSACGFRRRWPGRVTTPWIASVRASSPPSLTKSVRAPC